MADRIVLTFRASMADELERAGCLDGASVLWALWPGYLDRPSGRSLLEWLDAISIPFSVAHTSGHAHVRDLERLVAALNPERIVPIHTRAPALYKLMRQMPKPNARDTRGGCRKQTEM